MSVTVTDFGKTPDGRKISLYTLTNSRGTQVKITDLGATLVSVIFRDKNGSPRDIILGYDSADGYYAGSCYFGAVIGRSGNRIDKARFSIGGKDYQLAVNDNENNLHSGPNGFEKRLFDTAVAQDGSVTFSLKDADGEEGYPGNFDFSITYSLTDDDRLYLHYRATSDADTVCNPTNHVYFNLGGHDSGSIENTVLQLSARAYTPVRDGQAIPTGEMAPVEGTVFDFTAPKEIGRDISDPLEQLQCVQGYDHNFCTQKEKGTTLKFAEAWNPVTGIALEGFSDLPGVQFYAGNCITENEPGKAGAVYGKRHGFCLETQFYPNSINQEGFAKPLLKAGEVFDSTTCYHFFVK